MALVNQNHDNGLTPSSNGRNDKKVHDPNNPNGASPWIRDIWVDKRQKEGYFLELRHAFYVDQAILDEPERLVVMRFGDDRRPEDPLVVDPQNKPIVPSNTEDEWRMVTAQDHALEKICMRTRNFAVFWKCNNRLIPDFNQMYELYDPCTIMFFYRNKHMMCDFGTGNNNKINWLLEDKQELIDIVECIYKAARKGRGLANSPKDYSTRYRY